MNKRFLPILLAATMLLAFASCGPKSTTPSASPTVNHAVTATTTANYSRDEGFCNSIKNPSPSGGTWKVKCLTNNDQYTVTGSSLTGAPMFSVMGFTSAIISFNKDGTLETFTGSTPELGILWNPDQNDLRVYELPANITLSSGRHWSIPDATSSPPSPQ
jgi:hypothetical protein